MSGKAAYTGNDSITQGTMTNNGAVSPTALSPGDSYTIPEGYHNGSGIVAARTLKLQDRSTNATSITPTTTD